MIGKTISHYKILGNIGAGGMGVVYKAEDTKLKRTVALKFLPDQLTLDYETKNRFIHEAQAASALDHINICTIYEIDETDDHQLFMAMSCYNGQTLQQRIAQSPLPYEEASSILSQVAQGLAKAHQKGIIHRDIKPANIMVTNDGIVKILDFGLAKLSGQTMLTKEGTTLGTISYMSPEQTRGGSVDQRTDIWSLGVILYEMLTGELPFRGEYDQAVIYSILNEDPQPNENIPPEFQQIIDKTLSKNPDDRYQKIDEIFEDLEFVRPKSGKEKYKIDTRPKKAIRNKLLYVLAGIVFIFAIMLLLKIEFFYSKQTGEINSIAVLPFVNFSKDTEQEYFTDGMTDALITELSKISALRVISRTSVMQYKKVHKSLLEIAEELNVDAVVEGSVLREGNKVRITAKLIKTVPEKLLWADDNERDIRDVLTLQKEVARAITNEIRIALTPLEEANLARIKTVNPEAYELYLQGRYLVYNYLTSESIYKSVNYFLEALEKDANYVQAYAGLADAYTILGNYAILPPNETFPKAKTYAIKALEIDETLAEGHAALGYVKMIYDWDWTGAEKSIKQAIELNPGYSYAYGVYSWYVSAMGRFDEAIEIEKQAIDLNPLSVAERTFLGQRLYVAGRYDDAIVQLKKTLDADPDYYDAHWNLGWVYEQKKMYGDAIIEFQKAIELSEGMTTCIASLGHAYAMAGKTNESTKLLHELKELSKQQYVSSYDIAVIYTGLGEFDKAITWLEKAYEQRDGFLGGWINIDPRLSVLYSDRRFVELLSRIGFDK